MFSFKKKYLLFNQKSKYFTKLIINLFHGRLCGPGKTGSRTKTTFGISHWSEN